MFWRNWGSGGGIGSGTELGRIQYPGVRRDWSLLKLCEKDLVMYELLIKLCRRQCVEQNINGVFYVKQKQLIGPYGQ